MKGFLLEVKQLACMAESAQPAAGVSEETRRAEREHFQSVCRAFVYYREHGLQIIKKAEVRLAPASSCTPPCLGPARAELRWRTRKRAHAPGAAGRQFTFKEARHRAPAPGRRCMHSPTPTSITFDCVCH